MKLLDERIWSLFRRNWPQTLTYWSVFFSFGLCIAFLGPTILDLSCQTHSTLQDITWVFFSQQLFLLVGSSAGGLFKKTLLSSLVALFFCTLIISFVFAIIPLCRHIVVLSLALAVAGTAMGVIDTIANLRLVKLYQKDSSVFLQALHFFIGLGALVSPLVADPFLAEGTCLQDGNMTNTSISIGLEHHIGDGLHNISQDPLGSEDGVTTSVSYAFWIMALINLPVPIIVLLLMYHERLLPCFIHSPRLLDPNTQSNVDSSHGCGNLFHCCNLAKLQGHPPNFFILHALGGAILFATDGIIGSYAAFVYTYAVSPPLLMAHKEAGYLDSVFWAAIALGRLAFIVLSCRYTPSKLLLFSLAGVVLVNCLLLIFSTSCEFLFIGTCVMGLCISGVFPSMVAYTEDILEYKGCATTVLVSCASLGEMLMQLLVGSVINSHGSYAFQLCCAMVSFICFSLFLLFLYSAHLHKKYQTNLIKGTEMEEKPKRESS
ncbi:major facilitator superfamily domain-containing protein 4A-like [Brachionichthys hirsutus]|uniref:major facilitator superfamily domain-containing protein 4A-like n=1 Tax=Brachionichthys hirsutus TaxID=412623 RepID=UPI0036051EB8